MFTSKKVLMAFAAIAASAVMAACGTPATSAPAATIAPAATEAPASTSAPTEAPSQSTVAATTGAPAEATAAPTEAATKAPAPTTAPVAAATKVNLNTATADEILAIPNTGNRMVREFQEYRPYTSIVQFRREIGKYVGDEQVAEYEKYVYVPVSPNNADAATLQQLPGIDGAVAEQLIAARPFASKDAFIAKLGELTSADQAAAAAAYVEAE